MCKEALLIIVISYLSLGSIVKSASLHRYSDRYDNSTCGYQINRLSVVYIPNIYHVDDTYEGCTW